jgi:hypothetical protein
MSPKARGDYKAPRDRHELWVAVAVAVAIVVVTGILVWVVRPNQDSGSSGTVTTSPATTTVAGATTTTAAPTDTTVPATSAP